ncbi:MAG: orotidine 5'-phosphate decarboxylase [Thaumarchaeota archaeon]|nr:orotidine 5'-phosphate decarboxylase [Nitrososphaerota archaeon]
MNGFRARMARASSRKGRIILANDLDDVDVKSLKKKTISNIRALGRNVCALKLNFHVILPLDKGSLLAINRSAHKEGLQTIADIKLNDIGNTNMMALRRLWDCGFDAVIANPIMGPENLAELVTSAHRKGRGVITLVHMSHPGAKIGYGLEIKDPRSGRTRKLHDLFLDWSYSSGVDGIVVGATVPEIISYARKKVGDRCDIYSPGVGTQGGDAKAALEAGSSYLIVGRTILRSKNPVSTAENLRQLSLES